MSTTPYRSGMRWWGRLAIGVMLLLVGAAGAVWALARYQPAARYLGVVPAPRPMVPQPLVAAPPAPAQSGPATTSSSANQKLTDLEQRLDRVENATEQAQGSAGRADALVVTFAARRALDRGIGLGYLEPLLTSRFAPQHQQAVATVITAAHQPVRLAELVSEYQALGPALRTGGPAASWWDNLKSEFGSLVEIHPADRPASNPEARYNRALQQLSSGDVDTAVAETMRLPGAAAANGWVIRARRYIAAQRALDELETAALMGGAGPRV